MYAFAPRVCRACKGLKKALDPLQLELSMSCYVHARNELKGSSRAESTLNL